MSYQYNLVIQHTRPQASGVNNSYKILPRLRYESRLTVLESLHLQKLLYFNCPLRIRGKPEVGNTRVRDGVYIGICHHKDIEPTLAGPPYAQRVEVPKIAVLVDVFD